MNNQNHFLNIFSTLIGVLFIAIGIINTFWGNDTFYGIFIIGLSLLFFQATAARFSQITGFAIKGWIKILIGLFIIWSAAGVGELFDKIDLMLATFR